MRKFPAFLKKVLLFAVIFVLSAGNMCFAEEVTFTTITPNEIRILRDTIESGNIGVVFKNGFSVEEDNGQYTITFGEEFPVTPTVVCTYQEQPGTDFLPTAQLISVSTTGAVVDIVDLDGTTRQSTGSFTFIAIGTR